MAVMYRHVSEAPPPLTGVDPRLARWVGRMLEKRPEARPAGARQAWAELEEVVVDILGPYWRRDAALGEDGEAGDAATTTAEPRITTTRRRPAPTPVQPRARSRWPLAGAALLLVLGSAAAVLALDGDDPAPPAPSPTPAAGSGRAAAPYDFDGDGRPSAAVGLADADGAGAVFLPGVDQTIAAPRRQAGLDFGAAVVSADFNRDGYADLAVGAPGADTRERSGREGAVYVYSGSSDGLGDAEPTQLPWPERDVPYRSAGFGAALATGDLNGDGSMDLAVGAPGSDLFVAPERSGSVLVYRGGDDGLSPSPSRVIRRPRGVSNFGSVLAIGDVNRDKRLDLLEGAPGAEGHASYCPGGRGELRRCRAMGDSLPGPSAIAVGDVTGDRYGDVVHGVPDAGGVLGAGAVRVWRGGRKGPAKGPIVISQDVPPEVIGHDEPGDAFGTAIAVAKLDRDRFADVVVGTPGQDLGTGRVAVLFGAGDGVDETRDTGYSADTPGPLKLDPGSRFGTSLGLLDLDGDRKRELLVTAPGTGELEPRFIRFAARGRSFAFGSQAMETLRGRKARVGGL